MEIKTDLGTADNILMGCELHQCAVGDCPACGRSIKIPISNEIIDYKSLSKEFETRLKEAIVYNGKLNLLLRERNRTIENIKELLQEKE